MAAMPAKVPGFGVPGPKVICASSVNRASQALARPWSTRYANSVMQAIMARAACGLGAFGIVVTLPSLAQRDGIERARAGVRSDFQYGFRNPLLNSAVEIFWIEVDADGVDRKGLGDKIGIAFRIGIKILDL